MTLSEFIRLMYGYIGYKKGKADFVEYLFSLFVREPVTPEELQDDEVDKFNPMSGLTGDYYRKIFRGESGIQLNAAQLHRLQSKTKFIDELDALSYDARESLIKDLSNLGFVTTDKLLDEYCADIFLRIIKYAPDGKKKITPEMIPVRDESGMILAPAMGMSAYIKEGKLYINGEVLDLPPTLNAPDTIQGDEQPYVSALFEAYSEVLDREIKPSETESLTKRYKRDFDQQRKAYYSIESIVRGFRDVYDESDKQVQILKEEAYEGIYEVYMGDYENGCERLRQVLIKITSTTLDKSTLAHIKNLIGNLEKKGLCHLLVNDNVIHSWVNIDE